MAYKPRYPGDKTTQEWLYAEFQRAAQGMYQPPMLQFDKIGAAPRRPQEGTLALANGTTWRPSYSLTGSANAALHLYVNGQWERIQSGRNGYISVLDFGVTGDGVTDDSARLQAGLSEVGNTGVNVIVPERTRLYLGSSISIPAHMTLQGPFGMAPGYPYNYPWSSIGGTIVMAPGVTINMQGGSALRGLILYKDGLVFPNNTAASFTGTCIHGLHDDICIENCLIMGFGLAFRSDLSARIRINQTNIDCQGGIHITQAFDVCKLHRVHCWPFSQVAHPSITASTFERTGNAFHFENVGDWNRIVDCFSFGYNRGFRVNGCNSVIMVACGADGSIPHPVTRYGFDILGSCEDTMLIGCQAAAQEYGFVIDPGDGNTCQLINCNAWSNVSAGAYLASGDPVVIGGSYRNTGNGFVLDDLNSTFVFSNVRFKAITGIPISVPATIPSTHLMIDNCFWGSATAGNSLVSAGMVVTESITSSATLALPVNGHMFQVIGSVTVSTVLGGWPDRRVHLIFQGGATVLDGGNLNLAGNYTTTAGNVLSLVFSGSTWYETSRSNN